MAATASIRVVKQFTYRATVRQFSNRYHIGTNAPPDSTHWTTFSDAVVAAERLIFPNFSSGGAEIVQTVGYAAGSEVPVFVKNYTADGSLNPTGFLPCPGDVAALIRYSTPDRSTKNHPIYCFNYYHAVSAAGSGGNQDVLLASQRTAMQTYAAAWITGFSDGTTTFHRSRPTGNLVTGSIVESLLTHRDLPH